MSAPRTPTETLMSAMEQFGESEPLRVVAIWVDEGGDICWSRSGTCRDSETVGMLECVKAIMLHRMCSQNDEK